MKALYKKGAAFAFLAALLVALIPWEGEAAQAKNSASFEVAESYSECKARCLNKPWFPCRKTREDRDREDECHCACEGKKEGDLKCGDCYYMRKK